MKTNREYKRMINNIEDLCSILTAGTRSAPLLQVVDCR